MSDGVLVIDKPPGMTSHDVVDEVRRRFGTRKVGHAGTLDPDATGVLVVGVGRATRFLSYSQAAPKRYRATAVFGAITSTQDASGDVLERRPILFGRQELVRAMTRFVGEISQVPPMVSAVRIGGECLYHKARRGEDIERPARRVTIYSLDVLDWEPPPRDGDEARATLDVRCSAGTYVRTLVHDLGLELGCGAYLEALRRIEAGGFSEHDACPLGDLDRAALRPLIEIARQLPRVEVGEDETTLVKSGRALDVAGLKGAVEPGEGEPTAVVRNGDLVAVYRRKGDQLVADRVVSS